MRGGPIAGLLLALVFIGVNLGWSALWGIAIAAILALIALMFAFYRRGTFRGPRILFDDAVDRFYGIDEEQLPDEPRVVFRTRAQSAKDASNDE